MLVVSGTGVTTGEDLFEGHSWTMGVVLLITVGVGLLGCVCAVVDPRLPTGSVQVTREPEVARQPRGMTLRSMRIKIINHSKEKMWSLSRYSGDHLGQPMISNKRSLRGKLVKFLRYTAIMSENLKNKSVKQARMQATIRFLHKSRRPLATNTGAVYTMTSTPGRPSLTCTCEFFKGING